MYPFRQDPRYTPLKLSGSPTGSSDDDEKEGFDDTHGEYHHRASPTPTRRSLVMSRITSGLGVLTVILLLALIAITATPYHSMSLAPHRTSHLDPHHSCPPATGTTTTTTTTTTTATTTATVAATAAVKAEDQNQNADIDCGTTPASATAAGCLFDPMSFSWLPPACYDNDLIDTFLGVKKPDGWKYYLSPFDPTSSSASPSVPPSPSSLMVPVPTPEPVPLATVRLGEHTHLYVSREFHLHHCTYMWRKMHRALIQGRPQDTYVGNYSHTAHCEHVLTKEVLDLGMDVVDVRIGRKFVGCGRVEGKGTELYDGGF